MSDTLYSFETEDQRMAFAMEEARRTLPDFLAAQAAPQPHQTAFLLKAMFTAGEEVEHVWIADVEAVAEHFEGTVANEPEIDGIAFMQRVAFAPARISDWMYIEDGYLVGGYTTQVIRAGLDAVERAEYDAAAPYRFR